jgi:hypothetical protein
LQVQGWNRNFIGDLTAMMTSGACVLVGLLALVSSACAGYWFEDPTSPIIPLTNETFDSFVWEQELVVVEFYNPVGVPIANVRVCARWPPVLLSVSRAFACVYGFTVIVVSACALGPLGSSRCLRDAEVPWHHPLCGRCCTTLRRRLPTMLSVACMCVMHPLRIACACACEILRHRRVGW